ncbi:AAA family ATPase [Candidatus Palauibacter soopunensis]|uniref:ATP-dependent nuclease n=1 Tax=Candidatus Palauibacter soopunensis TaxID=3056739 RepID=UPI002873D545|nr:AAA family ATPase [Candidatus Palauibacter soopunensis]
MDFWREPSASFPHPLLKGITLEGPPPLRGIQKIHAPFDYPITAICGRNGAGKSTLLGLAALSAARPDGWRRSPRPIPAVRRRLRRMIFAWDEFFFRRPSDPTSAGLTVRFDYTLGGDDLQIARFRTEKSRWANAPDPGRSRAVRFPKRAIDFVSLSRILPPAELGALRRRHSGASSPEITPLTAPATEAMSAILGQSYNSVEVHTNGGMPLAHCETASSYTGFDMGSGEASAIAILSALERLPVGGLLLIEEIEHGFHPEAQKHLIRELTRLISERKKQIVCTTHSEYILDALPREGRLLLEREPDGHRVSAGPTTRQAMSSMIGTPQPELTVYVEDAFAEKLVRQALPGEHRLRVRIVPIGSGADVVRQLRNHLRAGLDGPAICVLDGDVTQNQLEAWSNAQDLDSTDSCLRLPGESPPETWVLDALLTDDQYHEELARSARLEAGPLAATLQRLRSTSAHHDIPRDFALRYGIDEELAPYLITACVADHPDLQPIRDHVASYLNGA